MRLRFGLATNRNARRESLAAAVYSQNGGQQLSVKLSACGAEQVSQASSGGGVQLASANFALSL